MPVPSRAEVDREEGEEMWAMLKVEASMVESMMG